MTMKTATIKSEINTTFNKLNALNEKILFEYYKSITFSIDEPIIPASFIDQNFKYLNITAIWESMTTINLSIFNEKDFEEWMINNMPMYYKMLSLYSHFGSCISVIPPCSPELDDDAEMIHRQIATGYNQLLGLFLVSTSGQTIPLKTIPSLMSKHTEYDNISSKKIEVLQTNFKILKLYANSLYLYVSKNQVTIIPNDIDDIKFTLYKGYRDKIYEQKILL